MIMLPSVILAMPAGDDRDYMEWLYKEHYRLMFSTAWKVFKDKATVDDIVSESCLALMKKIPTLRGLERNKLRVYIVSTVRNTSLNFFDKQQRINSHVVGDESEAIEAVSDGFDVEEKVVLEDELSRVWKAIKQLPTKEQQIMRMKYAMEMADDEIAKEVGRSANSIRKYVGRARDRIKAIVYAE